MCPRGARAPLELGLVRRYRHMGGIVADDMGLGKTLQVSMLLLHFKNIGRIRIAAPGLVVVPLTAILDMD